MTPSPKRRLFAPAAAVGTAAALVATLLGASPAAAAGAPAPSSAQWGGSAANTAGGTDYFIDATEGDDAAAGTSAATAWKSLTRASEATYGPGDRILLQAGETWHGQQLTPNGAGAEGRPVVIAAYGESDQRPYIAVDGVVPSPFVSGTRKNPETVGRQGAVNLINTQYWEVRDLAISNDDDFATDITAPGVVRDGVSVSINADTLPAGADTIMNGFRIHNLDIKEIDGPSTWQQIHYGGVNFQVFGSKQYGEYPEGGHYFQDVRIENNTFTKVELHAVQFGFNWFGNAEGRVDETGKFHEGWEQLWVRDRDLYSRDVYIGHNYAVDTGQGAIQLANTKDMVVEYNEVNGFLRRYNQVSAGLYLWAGADTVMRYNEVYDGPANEYDATPWDFEFTNFDVTYEYNYSHDNKGGWMSYMGNSSNSVARYNLSINDNGVIVKNMLSTNYSPTYFLNNVFIYDADTLHQIHDEVLLSPVYFMNNVFYNTSTTTPTTWYRKDGALDRGVFSNNAFFEAGGVHSPQEPTDRAKVTADPRFVTPVDAYAKRGGVENIIESAARFKVAADSPLVDAGRFNERVGDEDFFGTHLYYGESVDIGIEEKAVGTRVENPVDTDPIEEEGIETRPNLALGKPATASSTHPHQGGVLSADKLTDGQESTRWAAADDAALPITIDIDFGAATTFSEVAIDEYTDSGTNARIADLSLQRWDAAAQQWIEFVRADGVTRGQAITGFGDVTSERLRLSIGAVRTGEVHMPTITEVRVYGGTGQEATDPTVGPARSTFDLAPAAAELPGNSVTLDVGLDGDRIQAVRYVGPEGNVLGSLDAGDDYRVVEGDDGRLALELDRAFLASRILGESGIRVEFASGAARTVQLVVVDSSALVTAVAAAEAIPVADSDGYRALAAELTTARAVLDAVNRIVQGTGNAAVTQAGITEAAAALDRAVEAYEPPATAITSTSAPIVRGTHAVGSRLTATAGGWSTDGVSVGYQWLRNGAPIAGATAPSYTVSTADARSALSVRMTATKDGWEPGSVESAAAEVPAVRSSVSVVAAPLAISWLPLPVVVRVDTGRTQASGTVSFYSGDRLVGTRQVPSHGVVVAGLTGLGRGTHSITAVYSGSDAIDGSTSRASTVRVW